MAEECQTSEVPQLSRVDYTHMTLWDFEQLLPPGKSITVKVNGTLMQCEISDLLQNRGKCLGVTVKLPDAGGVTFQADPIDVLILNGISPTQLETTLEDLGAEARELVSLVLEPTSQAFDPQISLPETPRSWSFTVDSGGGLSKNIFPATASHDAELQQRLVELPLGTVFFGEAVDHAKVYGLVKSIMRDHAGELFIEYWHPAEDENSKDGFARDKKGNLKWAYTKEPLKNFSEINKAGLAIDNPNDLQSASKTLFDLMVRMGVVKDPLANLEIELPDVSDEPLSPTTSGQGGDLLAYFGRQAASL